MIQNLLFQDPPILTVVPFRTQLLKWVGNKQRLAHEIVSFFPMDFGTYYEPFLGSGAVLASLRHKKAIGSDCFKPLIEIWQTLRQHPDTLKQWYSERWHAFKSGKKVDQFEKIKAAYNAHPNGADLLFLCRSCYGGVVRFRKRDGFCSTPCGVHDPINPASFDRRVDLWYQRTDGAEFICANYREIMGRAREGDLIYCDPPYTHSQGILYGAQEFKLQSLFQVVSECKARGVRVAVSIDGMKKTGGRSCPLPIPPGLFCRQIFVDCGRSMLRRFQKSGETLEDEVVHDRLLLTY